MSNSNYSNIYYNYDNFCFSAWGTNDFAPAIDSGGFETEEGFDSFLAMQAPPEVSLI